MPDKFTPTHILYKGTSLEEPVMLIRYCHNPTWSVIMYRNSPDHVKIMTSTLTPIEVEKKSGFWKTLGKYVADNIAPVVIGLLARKVIKK